MNTELTLEINNLHTKLYMQIGFFDHEDMSYPLHKHFLIEMHIMLSGTAILNCDGKAITLNTGDVLLIPSNMLHRYLTYTKSSKRLSFFIDNKMPFASVKKSTLPSSFMPLLCTEIQEYTLLGRDSKLKALLSYVCSDFFTIERQKPRNPIANRKLIIEDFFSRKYSLSVTLDDLAKELGLSHKQTEREIKRITGNTFVGELAQRRIYAAFQLSQTTDLTLAKISELVGYSSYSGFYKAFKRISVTHAKKQQDI